MRRIGYIGFYVALSQVFCTQSIGQAPPAGLTPIAQGIIQSSGHEMDCNRYDSAYHLLSDGFIHYASQFSSLDRYYVHSLISEILYYNALFEQGLTEAKQSKRYALKLGNDTLLASSENMLGLLEMNVLRYDSALVHFRMGLSKFPAAHNNSYLAYRYHLLANLGECFVKMGEPDSALFYSQWSRKEATLLGKSRGVAFAYLNEAQAAAINEDWPRARVSLSLGMEAVGHTLHRDAYLFLITEQINVAFESRNWDEIQAWLAKGTIELENDNNTDYARLHFLRTTSEILIEIGDAESASALMRQEMKLLRKIQLQQELNRTVILKDYVHKSESLLLALEVERELNNSIFWRRITILILSVLLLLIFCGALMYGAFIKRKRTLDSLSAELRLQSELSRVAALGEQERIDAVELERNRIAADLHDDLGASLAGINIYSTLAMKPALDDATRNIWMEKIKSLSNQMIDNMSDIVWSIYSVHDNFPSVVIRMRAYATEVLSLQNINVSFDIHPDINTRQAKLELRHHLIMVFKEAILNISKYSEATEVTIGLNCERDVLILRIVDNGIGIQRNQPMTGNGLKNMEKRMTKLNGALRVVSENQGGTVLVFEIPLSVQNDSSV
jgi:signal transduction histidine kinase